MKYLSNKKGFTLIEMMVAISILTIMVVMAAVSWMLSLNHLSLRNDARDMASALKKAKSLVGTGRPHQVYFDIANEVYQIEDCNLDAGGIIDLTNGNNCNIAAATYFSGSGATHGTVRVGSLRDLRIESFGHKPTNLATILDGGGAAVNMVRFNTDGTAIFFNSAVRSDSTTLNIVIARTDGNAETKTIEINYAGRVAVP